MRLKTRVAPREPEAPVVWRDGLGDSDECTVHGLRARAYPDGRWLVLSNDGAREFASGEVDDQQAARTAALAEIDQRTRIGRQLATRREEARAAKEAPDEQRLEDAQHIAARMLAKAAAERMRYALAEVPLLERDVANCEQRVAYEEGRLAKAQALRPALPSRSSRIASAQRALIFAHAERDVALTRLRKAREQLGLAS